MSKIHFLNGLGISRNPLTIFFAAIDAKLKGAAPGNTAKSCGIELIIVLELEPVDQTLSIPVIKEGLEEDLTIKPPELVRPETFLKKTVLLLQFLLGIDPARLLKKLMLIPVTNLGD